MQDLGVMANPRFDITTSYRGLFCGTDGRYSLTDTIGSRRGLVNLRQIGQISLIPATTRITSFPNSIDVSCGVKS
jgi:hypothetical protein